MPLLECVPNFSEGRRPEVVAAIVRAMAQVPGVRVLDVHSDPDHNRSVVTLVGEPEPLQEAAFRGIAEAARRIDLTRHQGQHPFIGAADVVPFVPLEDASMAMAVETAVTLARRVAQELELPVYLYGYAARRPERRNLAVIRRGGYARLREAIVTDASRTPDFGPARLGPAGAVVIGARDFLIAYNVYLETDDVQVAKAIARRIRESSGGLPHVKALGLLVKGRAQVSMNLTDFRVTPPHVVMARIREEAARHGTRVLYSELVGMIPQEALWAAAREYLQLEAFTFDQVLEPRVCRAFHRPSQDVLYRLSRPGPGPALVTLVGYNAALAAALVVKLASTLGSEGTAARDRARAIGERLRHWAEVDAAVLRAYWEVVRKLGEAGADVEVPPALLQAPRAMRPLLEELEALVNDLAPRLKPGPRKDAQGLLPLLQGLRRALASL